MRDSSRRPLTLVILTVQNSLAILLMHYSRVMPGYAKDERYYTSTAVLFCEVIKLIISFCFDVKERGLQKVLYGTFSHDHWKLAIPATLYGVQNNLQYVAISNLPAATFQVLHQTKIISTGMFSVIILRKVLTKAQWLSLIMLTVGSAAVQLPSDSWSSLRTQARSLPQKEALGEASGMDWGAGTVAILCACLISGLSGVYFEKVLKSSNTVGLWTRNVQLATYSLIPSFVFGVCIKDGPQIVENGFFWGYNWVVWLNIASQAVGGIVVALAVKYADNIAKNFATAMSILISFAASVYFFDFVITVNFVLGSALAVGASYLYSISGDDSTKI